MVPEEDLLGGGLRLLEVDNRLVLPINTHIRILVTATDVLHVRYSAEYTECHAAKVKCTTCNTKLNSIRLAHQKRE
jgi:hypothetical protein